MLAPIAGGEMQRLSTEERQSQIIDEAIAIIHEGGYSAFTIRELAEKTLEMVGSKSSLINEPLPEDDPRQRQPDISLAKEKLGWVPEITFAELVAEMMREDLKDAERDELVKHHGYKAFDHNE